MQAHSIVLVALSLYLVQGYPFPQIQSDSGSRGVQAGAPDSPQFNIYVPERQQYLRYDFPFLDPYSFGGDKQPYPRGEPQLFLYPGGAPPGQQFLFQPGAPPPGNFLVPHQPQPQPQPQPGPNVILRDPQGHYPAQRPVFVAGYPKPAHIPPIDKDAEEIPTNPARIPPMNTPVGKKPEKIETFDEIPERKSPAAGKKTPTEVEVLAAADRNPYNNFGQGLQPGHRFFILNGQPLFSNYPLPPSYIPYRGPAGVNLKLTTRPSSTSAQNGLYRNGVTGQIENVASNDEPSRIRVPPSAYDNLVLLNQPSAGGDYLQDSGPYFRNLGDLTADKELYREDNDRQRFRIDSGDAEEDYYRLDGPGDIQDDSVVIEAKDPSPQSAPQKASPDSRPDSDPAAPVSTPDKAVEPTISQAFPGAIALAGPGGVASAAPRGNAFVGKEGVAVSSPQATAVAGPSRDEDSEPEKQQQQQQQGRKQKKKNSRRQ